MTIIEVSNLSPSPGHVLPTHTSARAPEICLLVPYKHGFILRQFTHFTAHWHRVMVWNLSGLA